jgi:rSAM/selenodomain-associated transferase 1
MDNRKKRCILFFVKYPEKGRVKTRLAADIGEQAAVDIYSRFVTDLLETLGKTGVDTRVCIFPSEKEAAWRDWLGDNHTWYHQHGADLGAKMENAFADAFLKGYDEVLVIGSDSPDLSVSILQASFMELGEHDMVIGPTFDGGYYLLGFKQPAFIQDVFRGISWSTEEVYKQTVAVARRHMLHYCEMPRWRDIDTVDDLREFYQEKRESGSVANGTMALLESRAGTLFNP